MKKVKMLLKQLLCLLWSPVSRKKAAAIVCEQCGVGAEDIQISGRKPDKVAMYGLSMIDPCWFVHVPWMDGRSRYMLCPSRIVLVSKITGKILYDGSARDEG
ncbi:MAG: hypothetical protein AB7T27_11495 [Kiritimatiellia bacterium]